jgi:Na+-driven multidrug efflux pump
MMRGFSEKAGIIAAGTAYLRIIAIGYPFIAVSMLAGRILQGLGIGTPVLVLTVMRLLLIAGPLAWVLVYWVRSPVEWVWVAMDVGIVVTALVSIAWLRRGMQRAEAGGAPAPAAVVEPVETAPVA